MFDWIKENSTAFVIAVILHVVFLGALFFNWQMDKPKKIVLEQGDIIQVNSVDANTYDAEIRKIEEQKKADKQRKAQAERKAQKLKEQKRLEEKKRKEAKRRKAEEVKQKAAERKKKAAAAKKKEAQRKAALLKEKQLKEKQLKEKKLKEQKRKEAEKKAALEKRKKAEAKKKQEAKRKEEARKKAQQEKVEQLRKAEAEKKRQAEQKRKEERERADYLRKSKGIVNRHVALITQKIERNWRRPLGSPPKLQCKVEIALRASGNVVSVKIVESSGNQSFDRSVETAVRKASPLPVPADSAIFKEFEVMRLRFEPGSY